MLQTSALPRSEQGLSFPGTARHLSASPCTFGIAVHFHRHNCPRCPRPWVVSALAWCWAGAQAGFHSCALVQNPGVHLPARERGRSRPLGPCRGLRRSFPDLSDGFL